MKVLLKLTIILLILPNVTRAQTTWAPPGATWYYQTSVPASSTGYTKIEYVGDKMIGGIECKALAKTRVQYNFYLPPDTSTHDTAYTYSKGDSVFYYQSQDNQFYLLYDFSAQFADTLVIGGDGFGWCHSNWDSVSTVYVDSVGTITINGQTLRWKSVRRPEYSPVGIRGKIIERIGPVDDYMFPEIWCMPDVNEGGRFRCYYDDNFALYQRDTAIDCAYVPGLGVGDGLSESNRAKIYPNPVKNKMNIELSGQPGSNYDVDIYTVLGQRVKSIYNVNSPHSTIDLGKLRDGFYFVVITGDENRQWKERIIVNRQVD